MERMILRRIGTAAVVAGGLMAAPAVLAEESATPGRLSNTEPGTPPATEPTGELITAADVDKIVAALELEEFEVEVTKDDKGNPKIESTDESEPFVVYFHGCKEGKNCLGIEFHCGWNLENGVSATVVESWNSEKPWGVAYRDGNRDPRLAMSVNLYGGVTKENFEETVALWSGAIYDFEDHIGWDD